MQVCPDLVRHCLLFTGNELAVIRILKKKKKIKEKEKCGETAVSVTNGYGLFSVYMFL